VLEILFSFFRHMVNNQFFMHIEFEQMLPFEAWYLIKKKKKHFQFWSHLKKVLHSIYIYMQYIHYCYITC
jgi:hypothetical protein